MNMWAMGRMTLMVALLLAATAWPVHAADRDKLLTDPVCTALSPHFKWITTGGIFRERPVSSRCRKRRS